MKHQRRSRQRVNKHLLRLPLIAVAVSGWVYNYISQQSSSEYVLTYITQNGKTVLAVEDKGGGGDIYQQLLQEGENRIGYVTQGFGKTEFAITSGFYPSNRHIGVDIVFKDYNIPSPVSGTVIGLRDSCVAGDRGCGYGYGNNIVIESEGYTHYLSHLDSIMITVGDEVVKGQVIATMGNTGASTGAHLDYRIYKEDSPQNPFEYYLHNLNNISKYIDYWSGKRLDESLEHSIRENVPIARKAQDYGCATELMMGIWYRESSFSRTNPPNGQGIFQILSGGYRGDVNFEEQIKASCEHLRGKVGGADLSSLKTNEDFELAATALGRYNGIRGKDWWNGSYVVSKLTDWWWFNSYEMVKCSRDYCVGGTIKDNRYGAMTIAMWMKANGYK